MNKISLTVITLLTFNAGISFANERTDQILKNTSVTTTLKLMQDKHDQKCEVPSESKIRWFCMGALPSVTKPTIIKSGCYFNLSFKCESESVSISGSEANYSILLPSGKFEDDQSENGLSHVIIENIEIN